MRFCPMCANNIEGKKVCICGYNVETNEVDEIVNKEYNDELKRQREFSNDNMDIYMQGFINNNISKDEHVPNKGGDIIDDEYIKYMKEHKKDE